MGLKSFALSTKLHLITKALRHIISACFILKQCFLLFRESCGKFLPEDLLLVRKCAFWLEGVVMVSYAVFKSNVLHFENVFLAW